MKWLSIELSLLLLVSMVAFAGFVSWQDSGDDLTGFAAACGGSVYGTCPSNYQCRQTSRTCVSKSFGRCTRYAPVYGCVALPKPVVTPAPTSTPLQTCTDSDGGKNYDVKGSVKMSSGMELYDACASDTRLQERVCNSNTDYTKNTEAHDCKYGCKDGACLSLNAPKLSDFTEALLAGKKVQLRFDSLKGSVGGFPSFIGSIYEYSYNLVKGEVILSGINPNTGKFETDSAKVSKEEIIKIFSKFIFDSKTRTFRDDGTIPGVSVLGVYALDGSLKSAAPKLSDFTEALLAGRTVQLRVDNVRGNLGSGPIPSGNGIGLVYNYYYNPAKSEITISGSNPNTGKFETVSKVISKEELKMITDSFSKLIFDSRTKTFRDDGSVPGISVSGVYALDGSLKSTTPRLIKESVKCVFKDSNKWQTCYTYIDDTRFECSAPDSCGVGMIGSAKKDEKLTWKSTCGGYAYTTFDGKDESVEFKCAAPESIKTLGFIIVVGSTAPASDVKFANDVYNFILNQYVEQWNLQQPDRAKNYLNTRLDTEVSLLKFKGANYVVVRNGQIHFSSIDDTAPAQDVVIASKVFKQFPHKRSRLSYQVTLEDVWQGK